MLLSGGVDSATALALAREAGYECFALTFAYGQRSRTEVDAALRVGRHAGVAGHKVLQIDLAQIGGSALTDANIAVPRTAGGGIPATYVPARNTIFLSLGLAWCEVLGLTDMFLGVNAVDYSGYPDCRPEFVEAFQALARVATKAAVEGRAVRIQAPLLHMTKAQIIRAGADLGLDYGLTVTCYQADGQGRACGACEACRLRREGFAKAGVADPTRYYDSAAARR